MILQNKTGFHQINVKMKTVPIISLPTQIVKGEHTIMQKTCTCVEIQMNLFIIWIQKENGNHGKVKVMVMKNRQSGTFIKVMIVFIEIRLKILSTSLIRILMNGKFIKENYAKNVLAWILKKNLIQVTKMNMKMIMIVVMALLHLV